MNNGWEFGPRVAETRISSTRAILYETARKMGIVICTAAVGKGIKDAVVNGEGSSLSVHEAKALYELGNLGHCFSQPHKYQTTHKLCCRI